MSAAPYATAATAGVLRRDKESALSELRAFRKARGFDDGRCLLCALYAGDDCDVVVQTPLAQVRLDRFACTEGHLMIVPRCHVEHSSELTWEQYAQLQFLAYQASALIESELKPQRVFVAALGAPKAQEQSYPHYHIHVVPVYHSDERARPAHVLSWSSGVTTYSDDYAASLTARLARAWPSSPLGIDMSKTETSTSRSTALPAYVTASPRRRLGAGVRRLAASVWGLFAAGACSSGVVETAPQNGVAPIASTPMLTDDPVAIDVVGISQGPSHPTLAAARFDNPARPVVTGTLLTTSDGAYAFASDVDRDAVFKVKLTSREVTRIDVPIGAQPGQLVEAAVGDAPGVFAVLRARGAVLAIDPSTDESQVHPVCRSPRGLAYDVVTAKVYIACETGELQTLDPQTGTVERSLNVAPDLRDVQVFGDSLLVSRYRSAEVLTVAVDGSISSRTTPDVLPSCGQAAVMHRLVVNGSNVHVVHQVDTSATLETVPGGYGSGDGCMPSPIEPVVIVTDDLARVNAEQPSVLHVASMTGLQRSPESPQLPHGEIFYPSSDDALFGMIDRAGPLDLAVSREGRIAVTFTGDSVWPEGNALVTLERFETDGVLEWHYDEHATGGMLTSVAFDAQGEWIAQSREPAQISFEDGTVLLLDSKSAANTGLDLFYVNTGGGLSCAGCHPEGDEDGRTWVFPQGMRRTQTLGGGVMGRAPFHWDGEMPELDTLMAEVMTSRMSFGTKISPDHVDILGRWLDSIPAATAMTHPNDASFIAADTAAIEIGRGLFVDATVGCARCHSGAEYTDNKPYDVGTGGIYYTPTLLGIGLRSAYMHDGCARTLTQRFGICGGGDLHGQTSHLSEAQIGALVAFMQTL